MKLLKKWTLDEILQCLIFGKTAVKAVGHSGNLHLIALAKDGIWVKKESDPDPIVVPLHQILGIDYE